MYYKQVNIRVKWYMMKNSSSTRMMNAERWMVNDYLGKLNYESSTRNFEHLLITINNRWLSSKGWGSIRRGKILIIAYKRYKSKVTDKW